MESRTPPEDTPFTSRSGEANGAYGEGARGQSDWGPPPPPHGNVDLAGIFVILDAVRRAVPVELEARFTSLIREVLLTLRSLIDWYLERLDRPQRGPQVEDIPID